MGLTLGLGSMGLACSRVLVGCAVVSLLKVAPPCCCHQLRLQHLRTIVLVNVALSHLPLLPLCPGRPSKLWAWAQRPPPGAAAATYSQL